MRVVVGLGSNLGDRLALLRRAVTEIDALDGVRVLACSRVLETAPVGPAQPDYLNAAILVECTLSVRALLEALLLVERSLGRVRKEGERWGPRAIDLDILWAEGVVVAEADLTVPHAHLRERAFALVPLLEVAPFATDPQTGALYEAPLVEAGTLRPTAHRLDCPG